MKGNDTASNGIMGIRSLGIVQAWIVQASKYCYFQDLAEGKEGKERKEGCSLDGYLFREGLLSLILMVPFEASLFRSKEYLPK